MGPKPVMRVSQEAFDMAVQENIDEFEMEPDEALQACSNCRSHCFK